MLVQRITAFAIFAVTGLTGCTTTKYAYHAAYKLTGCNRAVSRAQVTGELVRNGYLHSSEPKGPYDIFHRPAIVKKGALAQEPYEDTAGQIAVAVCPSGSENYIVTEEWQGCKDRKDCTSENQHDVRRLAEQWGCQVAERSGHTKVWGLEDRQDWTKESCSIIVSSLLL